MKKKQATGKSWSQNVLRSSIPRGAKEKGKKKKVGQLRQLWWK